MALVFSSLDRMGQAVKPKSLTHKAKLKSEYFRSAAMRQPSDLQAKKSRAHARLF
jgi:hypothetical protein